LSTVSSTPFFPSWSSKDEISLEVENSFLFEGDERSIVQCECFSGTILIQHEQQLIICTMCHKALKNPLRHLEQHKLLKDISKIKRSSIQLLSKSLTSFKKPIEQSPIHGLLCFRGWRCHICDFLSKTAKGFQKHHYSCHQHAEIFWEEVIFQEGPENFKFEVYSFIYLFLFFIIIPAHFFWSRLDFDWALFYFFFFFFFSFSFSFSFFFFFVNEGENPGKQNSSTLFSDSSWQISLWA